MGRGKTNDYVIKVSGLSKTWTLPARAVSVRSKYPLELLTEPGMSLFVHGGPRQTGMASTAYDVARKLGIKVKCVPVLEDVTDEETNKVTKAVPGVRVLRMPDDWVRTTGRKRKPPAPAAT